MLLSLAACGLLGAFSADASILHQVPTSFVLPPHLHAPRHDQAEGQTPLGRTSRGGTKLHSTLPRDYYDRLGLKREATRDEVKAAYRSLSIAYHPDWNQDPDAEQMFKELHEAYKALVDENKRRVYDELGEEGLKQARRATTARVAASGGATRQQQHHYHQNQGHGDAPEDLGQQLHNFFKGGGAAAAGANTGVGSSSSRTNRRRSTGWPGGDIRLDLSLPLRASVVGAVQPVQVTHLCGCPTCSGSGVKPGARVSGCQHCMGTGAVVQLTRTPLGSFQTKSRCPRCVGSGQVVDEFCMACSGQGRVEKTKTVKVIIPPGVDDGQKLRIKGEGDAGLKGGEPGDLYVYVAVEKDPSLTRHGLDLHSHVQVSWLDAMLGAKIQVPVVDGVVEVDIKEGTQPGSKVLLKGRGVPKVSEPDERGDHVVTVAVALPQPQQLAPSQRSLMEELRRERRATAAGKAKATTKRTAHPDASTTPAPQDSTSGGGIDGRKTGSRARGAARSLLRRLGFRV